MMPFFCHNGDHLTSPPPAHCGIPPYQLDPKAIGKLTFSSLKRHIYRVKGPKLEGLKCIFSRALHTWFMSETFSSLTKMRRQIIFNLMRKKGNGNMKGYSEKNAEKENKPLKGHTVNIEINKLICELC
jgi:hypothetical protein